jgi:DNA mismatch repair protein MutS2
VPGVVHDISNTGETVFIEPYSVQQVGNELESLRAEEKLEEYKILRDLTALIRDNLHGIEADYKIVVQLDALQAVARFSDKMDMSPPEVNEKGYMKIVSGMHPLLWKALKKERRENEIVPLDMELGRGLTGMVITGSNAGGKTVALKTIGILHLMVLSGMHVPAGSGTSIPFLDGLYADIGDDQSIDQNLSTFSAHITRISDIIKRSGKNTLVIVDELGTGTDPEQGGALSCAILKQLKKRESLTIVSTHLGMLKAFAHSESGIINCAMEMKEDEVKGATTYKPTYKLVVGEPGTSHAFEIAESLGLHPDIIKEARHLISGQDAQIESLISDLKEKNRAVDRRMHEINKFKKEAEDMRASVEREMEAINFTKKEHLSKALSEACEIIRSTKSEARDIIEKLKKANASGGNKALESLNKKHADIKRSYDQVAPVKLQKLTEVFEGQTVFIKSLGINGTIHNVNEKSGKCIALVSGKEITIPFKDIYSPEQKKVEKKNESSAARAVNENRTAKYLSLDSEISNEINVIGQRVDPAISMIERYLNDAALSNLSQVKIIHGRGTGTLSSGIRAYLKDHPLVESSRRGDQDEGGDAVTVVTL